MASSSPDDIFDSVKNQYIPGVVRDVQELLKRTKPKGDIDARDIFRAFEHTVLGQSTEVKRNFWEEHVFLWAAVALTIIFGGFGLFYEGTGTGANAAEINKSFLDIAKISAGAVFGGAASRPAAAAVAGVRAARGRRGT